MPQGKSAGHRLGGRPEAAGRIRLIRFKGPGARGVHMSRRGPRKRELPHAGTACHSGCRPKADPYPDGGLTSQRETASRVADPGRRGPSPHPWSCDRSFPPRQETLRTDGRISVHRLPERVILEDVFANRVAGGLVQRYAVQRQKRAQLIRGAATVGRLDGIVALSLKTRIKRGDNSGSFGGQATADRPEQDIPHQPVFRQVVVDPFCSPKTLAQLEQSLSKLKDLRPLPKSSAGRSLVEPPLIFWE